MDIKLYALLKNKINSLGHEGTLPKVDIDYVLPEGKENMSVNVAANTLTNIGYCIAGGLDISLGEHVPAYDNEWAFIVHQGCNPYDIVLPQIRWGLGISPSFLPDSVTLCRLYYIDDTLCGEWVCV